MRAVRHWGRSLPRAGWNGHSAGTGETTDERLWVREAMGERGYASPMHRHTREDEAFYVLDGQVAVYVGDEVTTAGAGSFLWAPRDVAHGFCVESDTARFLAFSAPAGFDRFFFATGDSAGAPTVPPPAAGPPDIPALVAAMAEFGVEMVGPPPAPRG